MLVWARRLFAEEVLAGVRGHDWYCWSWVDGPARYVDDDARLQTRMTYDLALVFLLLRLRRRTRFFLHLALIFDRWRW